ncbi:MAG: FGGY-family carbohydrate kinase [Spirochaetales bacterium]
MHTKSLVLGFELSTQSAKWVVLDTSAADNPSAHGGAIVHNGSFEFDDVFPDYGTYGGVLTTEDPQLRHAPAELYLDALDEIFRRLGEAGVRTAEIGAIKCDAHQHCTIYSDATLPARLAGLASESTADVSAGQGRGSSSDDGDARGRDKARGRESLAARIAPGFTRASVPIWEDRTTGEQAAALTRELAGAGGIEQLTANRAELRFPAAQIIRWAQLDPTNYARTAHIQLLSAFLTSVLTGHLAPVDTGDGWGTNLNHIDIDHPGFSGEAIAKTAKLSGQEHPHQLQAQLGCMVAYDTPVGTVSEYFARNYGVARDAVVLAGTGDNPATLLGVGDGALVSMGSSYTVCGPMETVVPSPGGSYNVFGYRPGYAMALTVITNGGKLHREFCEKYADGDWTRYAELAGSRDLDPDNEPLMLPYLSDESVPTAPAGIRRDGFDESDAHANIRALHLSQVASMRLHSQHLAAVDRVNVVGGGAANQLLRRGIADAFGATVKAAAYASLAAPFGCALSAARYLLGCTYYHVIDMFAAGADETPSDPAQGEKWERLVERYAELERRPRR